MAHDTRSKRLSFPCPEQLCVLEFEHETDLRSDIENDQHKLCGNKKWDGQCLAILRSTK